MEFTLDQKIAALSRELAFRKRVYARQVLEGRMPQQNADKEIGVMKAILDDYTGRRDEAQPSLF